MLETNYTAKYTRTETGFTGQIVQWPEVVSEAETLEECRHLLNEALKAAVLARRQRALDIPAGGSLEDVIAENDG